jgi:ankyrin repeat protein
MGIALSALKPAAATGEATLVQPAISGDDDLLKTLIGRFIASYTNDKSEEHHQQTQQTQQPQRKRHDPKMQQFVNRKDAQGNTALIGAVFGGHLDICKFLLEQCGADVTLQNNMGCSPIWIAAGYSKVEILQYLIHYVQLNIFVVHGGDGANGANGDGGDHNNDENEIDKRTELRSILLEPNKAGDSPFLAATSKGHLDILKTLFFDDNSMPDCKLEHFPSSLDYCWKLLTTTNKAGDTPLSVAVGTNLELELVTFLLEKEEQYVSPDTSAERPLATKNRLGFTPAIIACERNNVNTLSELTYNGADLNTKDSNGRSVLAIASFCGCMEVATYLLSSQIGKEQLLNQKDDNGCTPLWLAARTGNVKMVELLIEAGADISIKGASGLSTKEVAQKYKKDKVVEYLDKL